MKRKKRILLIAVTNPAAVGGQTKIANYLLKHLQSDFEMHDVSLPLPQQYSAFIRFFVSIRILFKAIYICLFKRIDVVHLFTSCHRAALYEKLVIIFTLRCLGKKTILNFHGAFDVFYSRYSRFDLFLIPRLIRLSDAVLCLHEGIKLFLIEKKIIKEENIFVIPNGIETDGISQIVLTEKDDLNILFLGWLTHNKGIDVLIEATARIVKDAGHKFHVEIYGPEMEEGIKAKLFTLIEKYELKNVIHIHDTVQGSEKERVLSNADVFVLPTRSEGFPVSVLEAMLLGLPVVVSDIAPMNKLIMDSETGLLFKLNDADSLAACLSRLMNDFTLRQKIGSKARKEILENYDIEKVISQFKDLYLSIANK